MTPLGQRFVGRVLFAIVSLQLAACSSHGRHQTGQSSDAGGGAGGNDAGTSSGGLTGDSGAPFPFTDLGGGERCYGVGPKEQIVGSKDDGSGPFIIESDGSRTSLPLFQDDATTLPLSVNGAGQIIGVTLSGGGPILFKEGAWAIVPASALGRWTAVLGIDDAGNIAGIGDVRKDTNSAPSLRAFYRANGKATVDLGVGASGAAYGLSSAGVVVGIFEADDQSTRAFSHQISKKLTTDLGTLGGANSAAYGVNARGDVVGVADTADGAHHAFLFNAGKMRDLGTLGGDSSDARAIDNQGNIVGNSLTADGSTHPFLYRNGVMLDLLPSDAEGQPMMMARVEALNSGLAVGWGLAVDRVAHCIQWRVSQ